VIALAARTSFNGFERHPSLDGADEAALCEKDLAALESLSYEEARRAHIQDHRALFDRVTLSLGEDKYVSLTMDERLRAIPEHPDDDALFAYVFDFARYLMIASSRPGTQPMNLQGIWSQDLRAIWSCNYTININTEMNYWPAEAANLPELHEPLFELIDRCQKPGRRPPASTTGRGARWPTTTPTCGGFPTRWARTTGALRAAHSGRWASAGCAATRWSTTATAAIRSF
jgi:alpha-L-fucosidase 2